MAVKEYVMKFSLDEDKLIKIFDAKDIYEAILSCFGDLQDDGAEILDYQEIDDEVVPDIRELVDHIFPTPNIDLLESNKTDEEKDNFCVVQEMKSMDKMIIGEPLYFCGCYDCENYLENKHEIVEPAVCMLCATPPKEISDIKMDMCLTCNRYDKDNHVYCEPITCGMCIYCDEYLADESVKFYEAIQEGMDMQEDNAQDTRLAILSKEYGFPLSGEMVVVDASVAGKASALVLHNKDYQTLPEVTGSVTTKEGTTVIGSTKPVQSQFGFRETYKEVTTTKSGGTCVTYYPIKKIIRIKS
jgi:hypothetical protein